MHAGTVFESDLPPSLPGSEADSAPVSSARSSGISVAVAVTTTTTATPTATPTPTPLRFNLLRACLWRTREAATMASFQRWFSLVPDNAQSYPLLAAVLKHETELPVIKHIGDILAWHSVLFSVLKPGSITRDEVGTLLA